MSDLGIGRVIVTEQRRDAVHVSVAPVLAWRDIKPGEHVGTKEGEMPVGIADPFLKKPVKKGQRFWMFLYWNTVQNLRHDWDHPSFPAVPVDVFNAFNGNEVERKEATDAIKEVAAECDVSVKVLMEAARDYIDSGDTVETDDPSHESVDWPEFWKHYKLMTLCEIDDIDADPFNTPCC